MLDRNPAEPTASSQIGAQLCLSPRTVEWGNQSRDSSDLSAGCRPLESPVVSNGDGWLANGSRTEGPYGTDAPAS